MKRATPDHPKTLDLQEQLRCSKPTTIGVLEMLWHFTAKYSPQGNIGKWSDEAIAKGIGWDGDAAELVSALASSGWIDDDQEHRYLIHDWADHADEAVKKALARAGLTILSRHRRDTVSTPSRPPEPEPEPEPSQSQGRSPGGSSAPAKPDAKPADDSRELLSFPTVGKKGDWVLTENRVAEWSELYPNLDILDESRRALAWVKAKPDRRKTYRGMPSFLVNWFNKSVQRGGSRDSRTSASAIPVRPTPQETSSHVRTVDVG